MKHLNLNPLQKAIVENQIDKVAELISSHWMQEKDENGFNALEISQLLGRSNISQLLSNYYSLIKIKLEKQHQSLIANLSIEEFEFFFRLIYRRFLNFSSYPLLQQAICNCPYLMRLDRLLHIQEKEEIFYQDQLARGVIADVVIKWINPLIGYGLFADADLPAKTFVGEYTGKVRQINKKQPDLNAYCFHYPTRFWSLNYFVIDALQEGNSLRFINHSQQPNLQPLWLMNRGVLHLIFIAKHFVSKGTELTFDYGSDYWIHRQKINF